MNTVIKCMVTALIAVNLTTVDAVRRVGPSTQNRSTRTNRSNRNRLIVVCIRCNRRNNRSQRNNRTSTNRTNRSQRNQHRPSRPEPSQAPQNDQVDADYAYAFHLQELENAGLLNDDVMPVVGNNNDGNNAVSDDNAQETDAQIAARLQAQEFDFSDVAVPQNDADNSSDDDSDDDSDDNQEEADRAYAQALQDGNADQAAVQADADYAMALQMQNDMNADNAPAAQADQQVNGECLVCNYSTQELEPGNTMTYVQCPNSCVGTVCTTCWAEYRQGDSRCPLCRANLA